MTKNPKTPTKDHVDRWNDPREDCFENYAHDALGLVQVWEDEEHPVVKYHCQCSDFSKDLYCAHTSIFLNLVAYRYIKEEENRQIINPLKRKRTPMQPMPEALVSFGAKKAEI